MLQPEYIYKAKIVNVVDGDTVDAIIDVGFQITMAQRLRVNRINTPETNSKDELIKAKALAAREFTSQALLNKEVIVSTRKSDAFGRYLAEIYYLENGEQKNLSDVLLTQGLAVVYKR